MPATHPPQTAAEPADGPDMPDLIGLHHVRVPVSDVLRSRDWYGQTLGLTPVLVAEDEHGVTGVVMRHSSGIIISLHAAPDRAQALRGFAILGLSVGELAPWVAHLEHLGVTHGGIVDGHLGHRIQVSDPDGIVIALHTPFQPSADEA